MMTCLKNYKKRRWMMIMSVIVLACMGALVVVATEVKPMVAADRIQAMRTRITEWYGMRRGAGFVSSVSSKEVLTGQIVDAMGQGLGGVVVQLDEGVLSGLSITQQSPSPNWAVTDAQGLFQLTPEQQGPYTLVISDGQHCPVWIQNVPVGCEDWQIQLQPSTVVTGQVVITQRGHSTPVPGIEVRATLDESCGPVPIALASDRVTMTDAQGCFTFLGLAVQLRDGSKSQGDMSISPTLSWDIQCGTVGDTVTLNPNHPHVHVKLAVSPSSAQTNSDHCQVIHYVESVR